MFGSLVGLEFRNYYKQNMNRKLRKTNSLVFVWTFIIKLKF